MKLSMKRLLKASSLFLVVFIIVFIIADKINVENTPAMSFPEPLEKDGCLGLTYHRVRQDDIATKVIEHLTASDELRNYSVYKSEFQQHIQFLQEQGATFVTPSDLREFRKTGSHPEKCVWISFDDVDESVYENAFPILKEHQIPFTLFLIAGHVGDPDFDNLSLATWEQIQEMVDSGLATIGSHTYDMHYLVEDEPVFFDPDQKTAFLQDLIKSKHTIEANLTGVQVVDFAYPYGDGEDELVPIIEQAGFLSAYILAPRIISKQNALFWQNRILVDDAVFQEIVKPWLTQ
ncbi:MAG: polysaccharide deacetylase family protein [Clostridia bacterium]|nr:polysaccharide deacetylase family protein [Clostridia bacterium]